MEPLDSTNFNPAADNLGTYGAGTAHGPEIQLTEIATGQRRAISIEELVELGHQMLQQHSGSNLTYVRARVAPLPLSLSLSLK